MKNHPKLKALSLIVLISVLAGVLVAAPLLIPTFAMTKSINKSVEYWEAIPDELVAQPLPQISKILDKNGKPIAQFYSENRVNVTYEQIPKAMRDAIVSIEDSRFYDHGAVDAKGTVRAIGKTLLGGSTQGGSTLTQQYVKNVLLYNAETEAEKEAAIEQTPRRKIREMKLAAGVETRMSKNEILAGYLNIANFGDGAYGVGAASLHYFGVPVNKLTLEQAAMLAGMVQNPSGYNPRLHPETAKNRRDTVLMRMEQTKHITMSQKVAAQKKPLKLTLTEQQNGCFKSSYPFFCQMVRTTLANNPAFGETDQARRKFLYRGGLTIKTTLDPKVQNTVTAVAHAALGSKNQFATSLAVVEPGTGKILGIGTNRDFGNGAGKTEVNYATSGFQNGSTFKPITLLAALENGWSIDKNMHAPTQFCAESPENGCFTNISSSGSGNMNAVNALAVSSNTFFTKLSATIGTPKVQKMATRLGLDMPDETTGYETSTTLGVYNVTPIQVANVYATIAGHGVQCNPTSITSITDSTGKAVKIPESDCKQEINPAIADKVAKALTQVVDGPNPARSGKNMTLGRPAMGKTGTTTSNSSVWFAGGTPQYQMAVWVGDPRGGFKYPVESLRLYDEYIGGVFGSTASGPIWKDAMAKIHKGLPVKNFSISSTISSNRQDTVVPDVRGMKPAAAVDTLQALGLKVIIDANTAPQDANYVPNTVVAQSLASGSSLPGKDQITITLSAGSDKVTVGP